MSLMEQGIGSTTAAGFPRLLAVAVSSAWLYMLASPLRMALARPWSGRDRHAISGQGCFSGSGETGSADAGPARAGTAAPPGRNGG